MDFVKNKIIQRKNIGMRHNSNEFFLPKRLSVNPTKQLPNIFPSNIIEVMRDASN